MLAALLIIGLAVGWCAVAWRYLSQQRAELTRAHASAVTLAQAAAQDFIGVSQAIGLRAILDATSPGMRPARGGLDTAAARTQGRLDHWIASCACRAPRPTAILLLALDGPTHALRASHPVRVSPAELVAIRESVIAIDQGGDDIHAAAVRLGGDMHLAHWRYWRHPDGRPWAATVILVPVPALITETFRPALDTTLRRLLPLHPGRDTVVQLTIRTNGGERVFRSGPTPTPPPTVATAAAAFAWTESTQTAVSAPTAPASFSGRQGAVTVLLERGFWPVAHPSLSVILTIDVPALLYGIPGTPRPIPATAIWISMAAVAALGAAGIVALSRARRLMRARTVFFSGISHELRTPLTQVLMYGESLQEGLLSTEQRDRAQQVIVRETRRLVHMIENVLLLSRGGAQHIPLYLTTADLGDVVAETLQSMQLLLDRHRTSLVLTRTPTRACIDVGATRQIVVNLIDNALRHGPDGQSLRISVAPHGTGVLLTVRDEGPGIPRKDHRRVFRPFETGHPGGKAGGTGLGLALVKDLVAAMQGWVRIDDTPPPGLSITVWLPSPGATPEHITRLPA